ncbi:MAG: hypothetical protein O3A78_08740 [Nitrospinae bacterium]|nr:hypothetical protein [Nitrospinota bacterium]MDA1109880.1 hypothetical protein [Nitrospinota bacterium]
MFYPVKILTAKGKVKKVITAKSLSQRYWGDFFDQNIKNKNVGAKDKGRKTQKKTEAKKVQPMTYEELNFSED